MNCLPTRKFRQLIWVFKAQLTTALHLLSRRQAGVKRGQGTYSWDEKAAADLKERTKKPYLGQIDWHVPEEPA